MQKRISYAIRAIVTWAASFEELLLFFDYIYIDWQTLETNNEKKVMKQQLRVSVDEAPSRDIGVITTFLIQFT